MQLTSDGVAIATTYDAPLSEGDRTCFVVGHGLTRRKDHPAVRRAVERLRTHGAVVSLDFRGHGDSGGRSSVGNTEIHDLEVAVAEARSHGHDRIVSLGFSMGAAIAIRHAALIGGVDAVVAVSGPARWFEFGTPPMRRVHWVCDTRMGRWVGQIATRTRLGATWDPIPAAPIEVVGGLGVPLLVVHGDADGYFPLDHPRALAAAAPDVALWLIPDMGHATRAVSPELLDRIAGWAADRIGAGPHPAGDKLGDR
ncbi:MAG: alpha/beta hydrolase family protein [Mycobacteriales bacterium]